MMTNWFWLSRSREMAPLSLPQPPSAQSDLEPKNTTTNITTTTTNNNNKKHTRSTRTTHMMTNWFWLSRFREMVTSLNSGHTNNTTNKTTTTTTSTQATQTTHMMTNWFWLSRSREMAAPRSSICPRGGLQRASSSDLWYSSWPRLSSSTHQCFLRDFRRLRPVNKQSEELKLEQAISK